MMHHWFAVSLIGAFACTGTPADDKADTGSESDTDTDSDTDSDTDTDADTDTDTDSDTDTDTVPPSPTVTAMFTPATVTAGEASQLEVWIDNYLVVDPTASPPPEVVAGEGHYHLYLDGQLLTAGWTPSLTLETAPDDPVGDYVFRVALVDSGHTEIVPTVEAEATLTIE